MTNDEVGAALARTGGIGLECFVEKSRTTWFLVEPERGGVTVEAATSIVPRWRARLARAKVIHVAPHDRLLDQPPEMLTIDRTTLGQLGPPVLVVSRLSDLVAPDPAPRTGVWMHADDEDPALISSGRTITSRRTTSSGAVDEMLAVAAGHRRIVWFCHGERMAGTRDDYLDLGRGRRLSIDVLRQHRPSLSGCEVLVMACQRPGRPRPGGTRSSLGLAFHALGAELVVTALAPIDSDVAAVFVEEFLTLREGETPAPQAWKSAMTRAVAAASTPDQVPRLIAIGRGLG